MTNLVTFPGLGLSFEINRVAFSIGGIAIYWYGIMIAVGIMLAMVFAFRHCAEFGIDGDTMVDVIVVGVVMAIVCARIYYVAMSPIAYNSLWEMVDLRQGGIAIYGGVIGAIIFGGLACKWRKIPVLPMFDLTAMGFLIGQCLGRWGNFFNQEAFGCNTTLPWGMYSAATEAYLSGSTVTVPNGVTIDPSMPVHPTFLYESIWCLVGFVALRLYMKKRRFNGDIALLYAIWYGLGRFWIEGLRTDSLYLFNWTFLGQPIRVSQALSLVLAAVSAVMLFYNIQVKKHAQSELWVNQVAMARQTAAEEAGTLDSRPEGPAGEAPSSVETENSAEPEEPAPARPEGTQNAEPEKEEADGNAH